MVSLNCKLKTQKNDITKAREYYKESGDIEGTLRQLPRHLVAERAILQCLKKHPGNQLQALKAIPRTLRMMYVHSYESYLWNHAASVRVKKYGANQVFVGDLVHCHGDKAPDVVRADSCEYGHDTSGEGGDMLDEASGMDLPVGGNSSVKVVTSEDISSGKYTVDDIVLPLPGSRVIYPANDVTQVFEELAKKEGINLKESVHNVKEFSITSVTGGYRRVFQKPIDFDWLPSNPLIFSTLIICFAVTFLFTEEKAGFFLFTFPSGELLRYGDSTKPLAETDLDIIAKSKPLVSVEPKGVPNGNADEKSSGFQSICEDGGHAPTGTSEDPSSNTTATKIALKLGLTLPSSCYATMAIRELLKTSTSVAFHKALNHWLDFVAPQGDRV
ncbi:hypothetical protein MLD38_017873 [Melastoma candidum]|uniref:Uncharacterized protein n=1 Tax=Melastoma candidum TaxID=119954 RepID=A0ACB9QS09_9MYRT|nr:hypothetical protein MLD38_017873 [Melastoma candidum]